MKELVYIYSTYIHICTYIHIYIKYKKKSEIEIRLIHYTWGKIL